MICRTLFKLFYKINNNIIKYMSQSTKKFPKRIDNLFFKNKKSRGKRITLKIVEKYPKLFPEIKRRKTRKVF